MERKTKADAEFHRANLQIFNTLWAYHNKYCPTFTFNGPGDNYFLDIDSEGMYYMSYWNGATQLLNVVYFSQAIAMRLVEDLKTGLVIL